LRNDIEPIFHEIQYPTMPGINRIRIVGSDWHDHRHDFAQAHEPLSSEIYRQVFPDLKAGEQMIETTKEDAMARYDHKEGVDVILEFEDGMRMTVQEKILSYPYATTITFEDEKNSGAKGAWYYCTAQLYFTAYSRRWEKEKIIDFQDWILINYTSLRLEHRRQPLPWGFRANGRDGRRSTFRYLNFDQVPLSCIVDRKKTDQQLTLIYTPAQHVLSKFTRPIR
jgi:hypothetical protein